MLSLILFFYRVVIAKNNPTFISIPFLVLTCFAFGFLYWLYGDILFSPNAYMFDQFGDGLKNYFTYAYHIKFGSSATNFEGMNYPYGEHFLYTDCHPVFAYLLKLLNNPFPSIANYSIGILNTILIVSQLFCFWVLYFLLKELKVRPWFAVLFSIGIFLMIPQIERICGHLALSYTLAIPFSWLLLIRHLKNPKWSNTLLLFLNNLFWLFIHAYLGIIVLSFLLGIVVLQFIFNSASKDVTKPFKALLSVVLPILIFYVFAKLSDPHAGRTDNPSGFFLYYSEFDNIIIPSYGPLWVIWKNLIPTINLEGEGNAYVGLINVILLVVITVQAMLCLFLFRMRKRVSSYFESRQLNIALLSSFCVLLISMGIPFVQYPDLLDYFPIIKQFRAIGRFSWPFFFVFTAFGAYSIQQLILFFFKTKQKAIGIALVLLVFFVPMYETIPRHGLIKNFISGKKNLLNTSNLNPDLKKLIDKIETENYQAIISLPFYHHGSEHFERPRNNLVMYNTLQLSYHTGIPNVGANLTRSSVPESKNIIQLIGPNYYPKPIKKDLDPNRPFLVALSNLELTDYEKNMLSRAKPLTVMQNDLALYELTFEDLFKDQRQEVLNSFIKKFGPDYKTDSLYRSDTSLFYYFNGFENISSNIAFSGKGAFKGLKEKIRNVDKFSPGTFEANNKYSLKLWVYNGKEDALNRNYKLNVNSYDPEENQWKNVSTFYPSHAETIVGNWSLVESEFQLENANVELHISIKVSSGSKAPLHADNLMIMDKNLSVYKMSKDSTLQYNNHFITF